MDALAVVGLYYGWGVTLGGNASMLPAASAATSTATGRDRSFRPINPANAQKVTVLLRRYPRPGPCHASGVLPGAGVRWPRKRHPRH